MSQRWVLEWSLAFLTMSYAAGCTEKPIEKIEVGHDYCDHCKMQITDGRFGGAIVTKFGKVLKYDSLECLAHGHEHHKKDIDKVFVKDFETQELAPLEKMHLYRNENARGPMGSKIQGSVKPQSLPSVQIQDLLQ